MPGLPGTVGEGAAGGPEVTLGELGDPDLLSKSLEHPSTSLLPSSPTSTEPHTANPYSTPNNSWRLSHKVTLEPDGLLTSVSRNQSLQRTTGWASVSLFAGTIPITEASIMLTVWGLCVSKFLGSLQQTLEVVVLTGS